MIVYDDYIVVTDDLTLGTLRSIEEHLRGIGSIQRSPDLLTLRFSFRAEDLWDAAMLANETEQILQSWGVDWTPDKLKVRNG